MNHPEIQDLTALAYGLVEGPERAAMLSHLQECPSCHELYESYRNEQSLVREVIVRDARCGAAEARALQATLQALNDADAPSAPALPGPGRGRWLWVANAAAALVIGCALFFVLRPAEPEVLNVAEARRAPGTMLEGEPLVATETGWKAADAVPCDQWVRAGGSRPLRMTFSDGASAEFDGDTVFRVQLDAAKGQPVVCLLSGSGRVSSAQGGEGIVVCAGDSRFVPLPGARIEVTAEADADGAEQLWSWSSAAQVRARAVGGQVVFVPRQPGYRILPMQEGEALELEGGVLRMSGEHEQMARLVAGASRGNAEEAAEMRRRLEEAMAMTAELEDLHSQLLRQRDELQVRIEMRVLNPRGGDAEDECDNTPRFVHVVPGRLMFCVLQDDDGYTAVVSDVQQRKQMSYHAGTLKELRENLPENLREYLDGAPDEKRGE